MVDVPAFAKRIQASQRPRRDDPCSLHVLVVDDCPDTTWSFKILLELWGHEAESAVNGADAIAAARSAPPDVVLLDLAMPGMDGFEVVRRLRREPLLGSTSMIAMSGHFNSDYWERAKAAGFDLYLVKPIQPGTLKALLGVLARR